MSELCHNCGRVYEQPASRDWDAVCIRCRQLRWLRLGETIDCTIAKVTNFGAMVKLGNSVNGLIHVSELTDEQIQRPDEVVRVGDSVQALVMRVDFDLQKVGLSIKRLAY
jgi:ribosomal protein S1